MASAVTSEPKLTPRELDELSTQTAEKVASLIAGSLGRDPEYVDAWRMSELMSCSEATVRRWAADGLIPFIKIGQTLRFKPSLVYEALSKASKKSGGQSDTE